MIHGQMTSNITRILSAIDQSDPHAAKELLPLVYDELRKLASQKLAQEKPGQTLQATALVHEARAFSCCGLPELEVRTRVAPRRPGKIAANPRDTRRPDGA
jgi:hypothetical protein